MLARVNVTHQQLDAVLGDDSEDGGNLVDGESVEKDAVYKLDVCVLAKLVL